jgi:hypothetical protein
MKNSKPKKQPGKKTGQMVTDPVEKIHLRRIALPSRRTSNFRQACANQGRTASQPSSKSEKLSGSLVEAVALSSYGGRVD